MTRSLPLFTGLVIMVLVNSGFGADKPDFAGATRAPYGETPAKTLSGKSIAEIKKQVAEMWPTIVFEKDGKPVQYVVTLQTDEGDIDVEFFPADAPNHARSFIALAKTGFYDGLIFHRTIPQFVIQGGCPTGTGTGGPGYCLKPEFNDRPHLRGFLSMARAQPEDSAGSQFFICVGTPRFLDHKYTVFGRVTKGIDVVDKIVARKTGPSDRPLEPVKINKAVVRIEETAAKKPEAKSKD